MFCKNQKKNNHIFLGLSINLIRPDIESMINNADFVTRMSSVLMISKIDL